MAGDEGLVQQVAEALDEHLHVADRNLGQWRTEVTCACGQTYVGGQHVGETPLHIARRIHEARAVLPVVAAEVEAATATLRAEVRQLRKDVAGQTRSAQNGWRTADTFRESTRAAESALRQVREDRDADVPRVLQQFADHDLHGVIPHSEIANEWYHRGLKAAQQEASEWAERIGMEPPTARVGAGSGTLPVADRQADPAADTQPEGAGECPACARDLWHPDCASSSKADTAPDWKAIGQQIKDDGDEGDRQRYAAWLASPQRFGTFPRVRERAFLAGFDAGRTPTPTAGGKVEGSEIPTPETSGAGSIDTAPEADNPEHDPGQRPNHRTGSFLDKRDRRGTGSHFPDTGPDPIGRTTLAGPLGNIPAADTAPESGEGR